MDIFIGLIFILGFPIALIVLAILLTKEKKKATRLVNSKRAISNELTEAQTALSKAKNDSDLLHNTVADLQKSYKKYEPIKDVEEEISLRKKQLQEDIKKTDDYIARNRRSIKEKSEQAATQSAHLIQQAQAEHQKIIQSANDQAEKIAGEAASLSGLEKELKKSVKALQNKIKGYGDEYIIPTTDLLDELAEQYDFHQASEDLKTIRQQIKNAIKSQLAAECDYVEPHRKNTAIRFVLDAFNGKVEGILSKVKHDNFGKLEQQINDAFSLVNLNGTAFRDARITNSYLSLRLTELKQATILHELKVADREEQKAIKAAMREEARVIKELEKARKDAEKEEKMLQQAMAKARKELKLASEEQKEKYQQQLESLQEQLTAAEEKNQRAMSMAQQTKRGHVYVISNEGSFGDEVVKIGMTRRLEPMDRVKELGDASVPFTFDVHAMMFSEDAPALENALHKEFDENRVNKINRRKEFFYVPIQEVRAKVDELGVESSWTMAAEARDYRESLAMKGITN